MNRLKEGSILGYAIVAAVLLIAIFVPLFMSLTGAPPYQLHILIVAVYYAILASSWALLAGYAGQFSFGHMAFMAVGAYAANGFIAPLFLSGAAISPVPSIIIGTVMAGFFGLIIGVLCLRLRRTYLALFTIAFAEILRLVLATERQLTNGPDGLQLISLFKTTSKLPPYYAHLAVLIVSLLFMSWLGASRFGLFLRAIREDEEAAAALGVHVVRYKVLVFIITSMIAGMAGAVQWHYIGIITPNTILIQSMSIVITMAVIGGVENLSAAAIGAFVIWLALEWLRAPFGLERIVVTEQFSLEFVNLRWVFFGILLMVTLRFFQNGLLHPLLQFLFRRGVAEQTVAKRQLTTDEEGG